MVRLSVAAALACALLAGASAGPAAALSCAAPDLHGVTLAAQGRVTSVRFVSQQWRKPWPGDRTVLVKEYEAKVTPLKVLRGTGAPKTFAYRFRKPNIDCDFSKNVKAGEVAVFTFHRWTAAKELSITAWAPASYEEAARRVRVQ